MKELEECACEMYKVINDHSTLHLQLRVLLETLRIEYTDCDDDETNGIFEEVIAEARESEPDDSSNNVLMFSFEGLA